MKNVYCTPAVEICTILSADIITLSDNVSGYGTVVDWDELV